MASFSVKRIKSTNYELPCSNLAKSLYFCADIIDKDLINADALCSSSFNMDHSELQ